MGAYGLRPVPEIQFRKYADPATEQLNNCGTMRWHTEHLGHMLAEMQIVARSHPGAKW